jgi:hypothetical protein
MKLTMRGTSTQQVEAIIMGLGILTNAGRDLFAQKAASGETLTIDRFLLANIPGLDLTAAPDPNEALPDISHRVAERSITKEGYVTADKVVYSLYLGTGEGDFSFNWVGLLAEDDTLVAVRYIDTIPKYKTNGTSIGNSLTRNFMVTYTDAQAITNISVDASTWQLSFDQATESISGLSKRASQQDVDDGDDDFSHVTPSKLANSKRISRRFRNRSEWLSDSKLRVGQIIEVLGLNYPGDGGGNVIEMVEDNTGTHDNGRYINHPESGLQGKGWFPDGVNIVQFGAVGDGVTNVAAAVQAAITASEGAGKVLKIPAGTYRCADRLFITGSITIQGEGGELVFDDGLNYGSVETTGSGAIDVLDVSGVDIDGLGLKSLESGVISALIHFRGSSKVAVRNCRFEIAFSPAGSKSIVVQRSPNVSSVKNISVQNNQFVNADTAVLVIGETVEPPTNIAITGNVFSANTGFSSAAIKVDKYTNNCIISGNSVNGNGVCDEGIVIEQGSFHCSVVGNTITGVIDYGIKLATDPYNGATAFNNILIQGNNIYSVKIGSGMGIRLHNAGAVSSNVVVSDNLISDIKIGIYENEAGVDGLHIKHNSIFDPSSSGMSVRSHSAVVKGNIVKGEAKAPSFASAFTTNNLVVVDNIFDMNDETFSIRPAFGTGWHVARNKGIRANSERAVGTYTISPDISVTEIYSTVGAVNATLGNGSQEGQIKIIHHSAVGLLNGGTVTVINHETSDPEVFTFSNRSDTLVLMWIGTQWITLKHSGVTIN